MISDWLPFKDKHITNISRDMARAIFWIYIIKALILLQKVFEKKLEYIWKELKHDALGMLGSKYVPCGHVGSHYCDIFVNSYYFPMPTI